MPSLELKTNVEIADPKAFAIAFSKFGADTLGKPEAYITTSYSYSNAMTFKGTLDPCFTMLVISLDNLTEEKNVKYSKALFGFIKEHLGIPDDRGYITFLDPGRAFLGHQSTTFTSIFAAAGI